MLKTPPNLGKSSDHQILSLMGADSSKERLVEDGVMIITHYSGDILVWGRNSPEIYMGYPDIVGLEPFGVCDSVDQFLSKHKDVLANDPVRTFFVTLTHVAKDASNKGKGGGWRWHKWGPYIGDGQPQQEYIDDEEHFDYGVFVYHVLQIDGPEVTL